MVDLEICVDSVESAIAAERGGAQRVELCSALSEAGITPSSGLIRCVREAVALDVFVMIRPRGGHFVFTDTEIDVMRQDILHVKSLGANGIVLGLLTAENRIDLERTRMLVELARPLPVTFHKAFDECRDLENALDDVISSGVDRLLTSGGRPDALGGAPRIAGLRQAGGNRIRIMAGGGVRASNVAQVVQRTGIRDVHSSLNRTRAVAETAAGVAASPQMDATAPYVVLEEDVRSMRAVLDSASGNVIR